MRSLTRSLSAVLTCRRGSWISLAVGVLALVALLGLFGRGSLSAGNDIAAPDSESAQVAALLHQFPDADAQTLLVVAAAPGGGELTEREIASLAELAAALGEVEDGTALGPFRSDDGEAAVVQVTAAVGVEEDAERVLVEQVRGVVAEHPIAGLNILVTGGPAFGVDVAAAFDGADLTLLLVTIGIVALLLIFTYRSPILWLIPLTVVALADQLAGTVTVAIGNALSLQFDTGIVSVLVFGAGTNYALLLISRYREELQRDDDHRMALATAWRATIPAIVASNVTVVASLLTLVLAVIPGTRGLGVASAAGLLIALAAVLLLLPSLLAVCGRRVFWPFVPRPEHTAAQGGVWRSIAQGVVRRPWLPLIGGVALLAVMAIGLIGASVGLTQVEKFRVQSESADGLKALGEHFPPGQAQPLVVIVDRGEQQAVMDAAEGVDNVLTVRDAGESTDGSLVKLVVTGEPGPGTAESRALVAKLRDAVHAVPYGHALVGGQGAAEADARDGNMRGFLLVAPLVLLVTLVVLMVLLRAVLAPLVLLLVNALSAVAAIGAGAWLSRVLFGWDALDLQVPLLAFLFLVALGVDYSIFLVHRARTEAATVGTRAGMVNALASTGGVITSAGVVLAGVFAALGFLPLVTLGQIGLIVGVGVLVDTLVVRTLVVPALFSVIGDAMWWPRRFAGNSGDGQRADREESEDAGLAVSLPGAG